MNNSSLTVFNFQSNDVRTILVNGEPAFCLSDVLFAYKTSTRVEDAKKSITDYLGEEFIFIVKDSEFYLKAEEKTFIFEAAVTFLLSRSKTELGKLMNKWLHNEILPQLRKTGSYSIEKTTKNELIETANKAIDLIFSNVPIKPELVAGIKLNATQELCPELKAVLEPSRQLLINNTAQKYELLTPTDIGLRKGLSGQKVNQLLIEKDLQIKNINKKSKKEANYFPTELGKKYSELVLSSGKNGDSSSYQQLRWYESVLAFF